MKRIILIVVGIIFLAFVAAKFEAEGELMNIGQQENFFATYNPNKASYADLKELTNYSGDELRDIDQVKKLIYSARKTKPQSGWPTFHIEVSLSRIPGHYETIRFFETKDTKKEEETALHRLSAIAKPWFIEFARSNNLVFAETFFNGSNEYDLFGPGVEPAPTAGAGIAKFVGTRDGITVELKGQGLFKATVGMGKKIMAVADFEAARIAVSELDSNGLFDLIKQMFTTSKLKTSYFTREDILRIKAVDSGMGYSKLYIFSTTKAPLELFTAKSDMAHAFVVSAHQWLENKHMNRF